MINKLQSYNKKCDIFRVIADIMAHNIYLVSFKDFWFYQFITKGTSCFKI